MHTVGTGWRENRIMASEKHTLQVKKYGDKH